ncbi:MAG: response regulator, partial [Phycisphaerales bacterium]
GMNEDQLGCVFKPFCQADESTTRVFGGTGLGLPIARSLAEKLGGSLVARSEPGAGSTFVVRIGVEERAAGDEQEVSAVGKRETDGSASRSGVVPARLHGHVLLVEDGPDNQRLITHILRRSGLTVEVAENGLLGSDRALAAARSTVPFDLVLMDMQMPVMDGYTATRRLRESGFETPIVALTANAMSEDRDRCLAAGCTEYVSKPVDVPALLGLIGSLLGEGGSDIQRVA